MLIPVDAFQPYSMSVNFVIRTILTAAVTVPVTCHSATTHLYPAGACCLLANKLVQSVG